MNKSIHIYESKNNTITALLKEGKETIKNTIVKCHPKDEYNFNIGAKIALDRLTDEEKFEEFSVVFTSKPQGQLGEYVTIGKIYTSQEGRIIYDNGFAGEKYENANQYINENKSYECYEVKKVKRVPEVGEYVEILNTNIFNIFKKGDIKKVAKVITSNYKNNTHLIQYEENGEYINIYDYAVLEGYKPIKDFKPYLKSTQSDTIYGKIGEETNLKDILGIPLKVGDIVKIYKDGKEVSKNIVAKHLDNNKYFIMGFWCYDFINGNSEDYKILFYKSHAEIKENCTLYNINYVIKEQQN